MPLRLYTVAMRALGVFLVAVFAAPIHAGSWKQLGADLEGNSATDGLGTAVAMAEDGNRIVVGAPEGAAEHVSIYNWTGTRWDRIGYLTSSTSSGFGESVAISSDGAIVAVGSPYTSSSTGEVKVYEYVSGQWAVQHTMAGNADDKLYGTSVSLSADGSIVAIGAPGFTGAPGFPAGNSNVYIYNRTSTATVAIAGSEVGTKFGQSVSLSADGSLVAVGAPETPLNSISSVGAWYVYKSDGSAFIDGRGVLENEQFGYSVSLSSNGSVIAVGGPGNTPVGPDAGVVRVYAISENYIARLGSRIDAEGAADEAGYSVSLSDDGNRLVVGAPENKHGNLVSGHARVFRWTGSRWTKIGHDLDGAFDLELYGHAVAMSGDGKRIIVGAPDRGASKGAVRVFEYAPSSSSSLSTGAIVGISVGGVAFVALIAILANRGNGGNSEDGYAFYSGQDNQQP
jgi:hypothetical protein